MILRSIILAATLFATPIAVAQTQTAKGEISDKTLKTLKALAWQSLPNKILQPDKSVTVIDKSDPSKIVIPDADAREVIRAAYLSARAQKCDLQELVIANRDALLLREKKTGKWSSSQLQYINTLHLFTVQLLVGKVQVVDQEEAAKRDPNTIPMPPANTVNCNDKEKQDISAAVAENEKLVLGKS
ncbi:hypothetical protein Rvan_1169 [Rhodomicrobium vannielii ATCC 17100]|jgi:hypothetical protein|uniref:Uncharacterized protein n=2 Tax=Rhodomicrobium TaxID=1068 RepID=E3I4C4_RHOVT|nr:MULTISPECIES: hypothetical protein [Rhodomicrobium]ADP70439.1 hypothetical protein Rvan_1169 [Rhodomicrobium vannielii ATCC 17100]KAI95268.1 hypothetical protein T281_06385 [Rhodomicrobium udaipurense JA643]MBJ7534794.1 hypothetical protein [Rhodomicrobium vannielii ATCC 17100]MBJ7542655.1 hypothetical protein [Rhodomicrobium udaipurense]